ncbi:FHA domain-containing protein [Hydrogenophaga sp. 5NK40-0174]|uniref:FHA domain-containing protein n=1 Tax=Hydrogenophaga sp. 5NK40-0174 TaxID=3127649 RepID=UPI003109FB43
MSWFVEILHRDGTVATRSALGAKPLTVGRSPECDLVVDDPYVAAHHASVTLDEDGKVLIRDLDTVNGIRDVKGKRYRFWRIEDARPIRLGHTQLRVRSTQWALADERPLPNPWGWLWAAIALAACMATFAWDQWVGAVGQDAPEYLVDLSAGALVLGIWAGFFALLGRLLRGASKFNSHLLIVCCATLAMYAIGAVLDTLAFSFGWVWPKQITVQVAIVILAFAVAANLHMADPRHWKVTRWVVTLVAAGAIAIPPLQLWMKDGRLTRIDAVEVISYPELRVAEPVSVETYEGQWSALREKVANDKQRMADKKRP